MRRIHDESENHAERIAKVSKLFVSAPYKLSPLGEGPEGDRDTDPIVSFAQFDCVTYIEEVMALCWYPDLDVAIERLQDIRYSDGAIDYGKRKHITMAQWIPQNVAAGFVTDITRHIAPRHAGMAELILTDAHFESKKGKALLLTKGERPLGTHRLPILSVDLLAHVRGRIPHGTIISTIRADRIRVPYRTSHVALVVVRDGQRFVRHAHERSAKVIEDRIEHFIRRSRAKSSWPVSGFNLLKIASAPPTS